jgi:protein-tyrosine phosphatase
MIKNYRRLPLDGLYNARDLGGYPTKYGNITKYGQFIRSEAPKELSASDLKFLQDYGITAALDFRGVNEVRRFPSMLDGLDWVDYHWCPMFNAQVSQAAVAEDTRAQKVTAFVQWGTMYVSLLEEHKNWTKETLEIIASHDGGILYNCTTGKDRTGLMSALLLGIAGVSDADITADYCVSQIYLRPVYEQVGPYMPCVRPDGQINYDDPFFLTAPENMAYLLNYINGTYGGMAEYVRACGVADGVITALRTRLNG